MRIPPEEWAATRRRIAAIEPDPRALVAERFVEAGHELTRAHAARPADERVRPEADLGAAERELRSRGVEFAVPEPPGSWILRQRLNRADLKKPEFFALEPSSPWSRHSHRPSDRARPTPRGVSGGAGHALRQTVSRRLVHHASHKLPGKVGPRVTPWSS
ncbi:hypothetical protein [Streptomyces sp. PTD5-9]|uniref:hypothetical protein n=1 Tax=Streptomyces sp. PTD5-9 TaxID=3120150 RepID=UPI00300A72C8